MSSRALDEPAIVGGAARTVSRFARESDIPVVAVIERASFGDPWRETDFKTVLAAPAAIFLVASRDDSGKPLGYAVALTVLDESEILNLAVDVAHRGLGLGGMLLDAALAELEKRGARTTFLEVRESNAAARSLYRSRGFSEMSRRLGYYRNPIEDALVLRRALQG